MLSPKRRWLAFVLSSLVIAVVVAKVVIPEWAAAQRRGGGGMRGGGMRGGMSRGGMSRGAARPSVTRRPGGVNPGSRPNIGANPGNIDRSRTGANIGSVRGNTNVNRPINGGDVNINRNVDWDNRYTGCCYRPLAAAAGVVAGAAITAAAIGSVAYALPPDCVYTVVDGLTYNQCGSTWYQPQFVGTETTYVVVSPP